ncbi:MAG: hypothetical protein HRU38_13650 [Saccharospirillaceae bacterium]|nr:hypothetical protein [Pseudomonadales bacterium]NRB79689.1 hypothetical protein [Saccharospirillaceae bacterium]
MITLKKHPVLGFSDWLNEGFWLLCNKLWILLASTLSIVIAAILLPITGSIMIESSEGNSLLVALGYFFIGLGIIIYPLFATGFWNFSKHADQNQLTNNYQLRLLISGFNENIAKQLLLGFTLLVSHVIFVAVLSILTIATTAFATAMDVDITTVIFQQKINFASIVYFFLIYPLVLSGLIYSPKILLSKPEYSVFRSIYLSINCVISNYFTFMLFIIFGTAIMFILLLAVGSIPGLIAGLIIILPWENQGAVLNVMIKLPQTVVLFGLLFCIVWFFMSIHKSYNYLFDDV